MSIRVMRWVWDQDIPTPRKMLRLALADDADNDGFCWPAYKRLARKTNLSRRDVIRQTQRLECDQLLTRQRRTLNGPGQNEFTSNRYRLAVGGVVTHGHHPGDQQSPPLVTDGHHLTLPVNSNPQDTHRGRSSKNDGYGKARREKPEDELATIRAAASEHKRQIAEIESLRVCERGSQPG